MSRGGVRLLLLAVGLLLNGCGSSGLQTTLPADLAQARLEGDYDVTYVLADVGRAPANSFDYGQVGDVYQLVWRPRPKCASGPCEAEDPGAWDPDHGYVSSPEDIKFVAGRYTTVSDATDPAWQCLPAATANAWHATKTIDLKSSSAVRRGSRFVISRFTAERALSFTPSAEATVSGCTSFTVRWQVVGVLYPWR